MAWNKVSSYKTRIGAEGGLNYCQYHSTKIVQWNDNKIILNSGGWRSVTTKRKMCQLSNQMELGFHVYQRNYDWYVQLPDGAETEFRDGMVIDRRTNAPSIAPTESEVEYNRDLALRIRDGQVGSGMSHR